MSVSDAILLAVLPISDVRIAGYPEWRACNFGQNAWRHPVGRDCFLRP